MKNINSRYIIKIPNDIIVLYNNNKQRLVVIGTLDRRSVKLDIKIYIDTKNNNIKISSSVFNNKKMNRKKDLKVVQGTTLALIKQLFLETSNTFYQKLNVIGVGYKILTVEMFKNKLFLFRLGFSHPIYFRIPQTINVFCFKSTTLFIFGTSYYKIKQIAAQIRLNKIPECYKGKGILYQNEKINLKEGKKI